MKKVIIAQLTFCAFLALASGAVAQTSKCNDLVKECYAYNQDERSNCFYTAANHPFCANSKLGDLVAKRWSMAPATNLPSDSYDALVGPELVDRTCVENFDGSLSGMLVNSVISNESIKILTAQLESCRTAKQIDLSRP